MDTEQRILEFVGKIVVYGGGAAAIAYGLFVFLGKRWIESMFAAQLEQARHEHAKELEHVKFEINTLLNRVTKLHEKEFEVVPEAWSKLNDVLPHLRSLVVPFQEHPDLDRLGPEQLEELLADARFRDSERQAIRQANNKNEQYQNVRFWHELQDIRGGCLEFHAYIHKNRIFMTADLRDQFTKISEKMWDVLMKRQTVHEDKDRKAWVEARTELQSEIEPLLNNIESLVQELLQKAKG